MPTTPGILQCVVIAPAGRLLDCKTTSVVLPAHDGQLGIWHNHIPMFCRLGLGIMEVKQSEPDKEALQNSTFLLVDGGFALLSSNLLTIIAYDAICLRDIKTEMIEKLVEKAGKGPVGNVYTIQQRQHDLKKAALLTQLVQMNTSPKDKNTSPE